MRRGHVALQTRSGGGGRGGDEVTGGVEIADSTNGGGALAEVASRLVAALAEGRWRRGSLRRWRRGGGGALVLCSVGGSSVGEVATRRVLAACGGGGCGRTGGGRTHVGSDESTNAFFSTSYFLVVEIIAAAEPSPAEDAGLRLAAGVAGLPGSRSAAAARHGRAAPRTRPPCRRPRAWTRRR
jgi:hypothetical protein